MCVYVRWYNVTESISFLAGAVIRTHCISTGTRDIRYERLGRVKWPENLRRNGALRPAARDMGHRAGERPDPDFVGVEASFSERE